MGQVERSEEELDRVRGTVGVEPSTPDLGASLRQVIAAVRTQHFDRVEAPRRASEWLAESYHQQARDPGGREELSGWEGAVYGRGRHSDQSLRNALVAAEWATTNAPGSGYAWRRRAELEFSFGRSARAGEFVDRALTLSPRLAPAWALKGFLAAARDRMSEATNHFARAIALDGSLGEARLGMGLSLYRLGDTEAGLRQLRLAAAVEPRRSLFRSYLGKAFFEAASRLTDPFSLRRGDTVLGLSATGLVRYAEVDLGRAREFDAEDPTPELYAALMHYRQNRVNAAIRELEASEESTAHRKVYRSGFLLDQDRAVRSANLAAIYRDAGMAEVGLLEASSAAEYDYGDYSAHLFLAGSYDTMRDPRRVNLRYDAAWNNELLLADLLAPVGAGALSQSVSQQEFSRLFDRNRQFGVYSSTEYASSGDWTQAASAYGVEGRLAYAVDGAYRRLTGTRSNQDLEGRDVRVKLKGRLTERDTVLFQLGYGHVEAGDGLMHYDPAMADADFRIEERLEPEVLLGWHREWSPGMHTLLMSGLVRNRLESQNLGLVGDAYGLPDDPYGLTLIVPDAVRWDQHYEGDLDSRFVEWQQIWQTDTHNLVVGTRYQGGRIDARNQVLNPAEIVDGYPLGLTADPESMSTHSGDADFWRWSLYAYHRQRLMESLWLTAGVGYDTTEVPENQANPPLSDREIRESLVSPKAGLTWRPADRTTVRGAFSRSLTGLSLEQDYRLEPSQVAGVLQSFRGLFPEALVATPAAATLTTGGLSIQQQFAGSTYLTVSGEVRSSSADDTVGTYTYDDNSPYRRLVPVQMPRALEYSEGAVEVSLVHLTRERWSFGVRYRLAKAEMEMEVDQRGLRIEDSIVTKGDSILHTLGLSARYQDPAGPFAVVDTGFWHQPDCGRGEEHPLGSLWVEPPVDSQESLWQVGARIGYRFPLRRGEISAGVLNLFDADYRLNPLNYHPELPRERTWVFRLAIQF